MKAQMKRADRSGATVAVIIGPDEQAAGAATVRDLRPGGGQRQVPEPEVVAAVAELLASEARMTPAITELAAEDARLGALGCQFAMVLGLGWGIGS